ncbi:hypothetical protein AVEN_184062-1 [Araneus ventricosus]|uniref:Uncharacterized protein n=1 Tax=Araneus ventricosus TaxID=182803 RepID=A0A4Y2CY06_ARAVE|nr:hypothetical protein AVEN_184062-1 [Araneus ventricosus]
MGKSKMYLEISFIAYQQPMELEGLWKRGALIQALVGRFDLRGLKEVHRKGCSTLEYVGSFGSRITRGQPKPRRHLRTSGS